MRPIPIGAKRHFELVVEPHHLASQFKDATIAVSYGLTAIFVYLGRAGCREVGLLMLVVFVSGTLMNTAQSSMPALAAAFYPTQRSEERRVGKECRSGRR